jgi:hypothetical protein
MGVFVLVSQQLDLLFQRKPNQRAKQQYNHSEQLGFGIIGMFVLGNQRSRDALQPLRV